MTADIQYLTPTTDLEKAIAATYERWGYRFRGFKLIDAETYKSLLYNDKLMRIGDITYKLKNYDDVYSIVDYVDTWFAKGDEMLGQVWCKDGIGIGTDDIKSYWINTRI